MVAAAAAPLPGRSSDPVASGPVPASRRPGSRQPAVRLRRVGVPSVSKGAEQAGSQGVGSSPDADPRRAGPTRPDARPVPGPQSVPDARSEPGTRSLQDVLDRAERVGLQRVELVAWRDLDDPEAGGSELHAHRIAALWAGAGLDVHLSTSAVPGGPVTVHRDGYTAERRSGRYAVFPRTVARNVLRPRPGRDGLVEVWNGMPFLSPVWARCPRVVFLHHVHAEMWRMVLPRVLATAGDLLERRLAPYLYRGSRVVTLSESSRSEIVSMMGLLADRVTVVPPGVDAACTPGGPKSPDPLVIAVGRLVPVKRFDRLIEVLATLRRRHSRLRAVIVGEGYEREHLQALVHVAGAGEWIDMPGRLADEDLIALYRRAWVLVSHSQREGWGMTITEAAACGTPAVVSRIAGHTDAVEDGRTGVLVDDTSAMVVALDAVLSDEAYRNQLARAASERARELTWEATAAGTLDALVAEAEAAARR